MSNHNTNNAEVDCLKSQVGALEELLDVHEKTVREQSARLEGTLANLTEEINDRRAAQAELQASRAFLQAVIDNIPEATTVIGTDYHVLLANRAARSQWGGEDPVGRGLTCYRLSHGRDSPCDDANDPCPLRQVLTTGSPVTVEHTHFDEDGNEVVVEISAAPVLGEAGEVVQVVEACRDVSDRKRAERELAELNRRLIETSRLAGMAEVATGVLHNVGNVLNSVNVSAQMVTDRVKRSRVPGLAKANALIEQHAGDLGTFITSDEKGRLLPEYLRGLSKQLHGERDFVLEELGGLMKNVEHIKEIVSMQQSFSKVAGAVERVDVADIVESALKVNDAGLLRHHVTVVREYEAIAPVTTDKHKVVQILVNLIGNAKYALSDSARDEKRLTIRIGSSGDDRVKVEVKDNGVGIARENLSRIFRHGFTTKKHGHGFGLHSSALAAKELDGTLSVHSEGPGQGATFTLELPLGLPVNRVPARKERPVPPVAQPAC